MSVKSIAKSVEIIIPTYDNGYWLKRCLESMSEAQFPELSTVHIVDNHGSFHESSYFCPGLELRVYRPGSNLGWTGGLMHVCPKVRAPFVMFLNDDTEAERKPDRLSMLLSHFEDPTVGMVGPATGIAMGRQALSGPDIEDVPLLIGFCQLVRMEALEKAGGLDARFATGGDDLDLSIRFRDLGYRLVLDRRVFWHHFAFKTGNRLFGNSRIPGGWNSQEMATRVYDLIAQKHGSKKLLECIAAPDYAPETTKIGS